MRAWLYYFFTLSPSPFSMSFFLFALDQALPRGLQPLGYSPSPLRLDSEFFPPQLFECSS